MKSRSAKPISEKATNPFWDTLSRCVFLQGFARSESETATLPANNNSSDENANRNFNKLKIRGLTAFELYGGLNPPAWATLVGMQPARSAYSYLLRLHRWGLLHRDRDHRGLLLYSITERGRERLAWLRARADGTRP